MKNLTYVFIGLLLIGCDARISVNSGKNDKVSESNLLGLENNSFQVTYEETKEDRLIRYELVENIRDYTPVMPELDSEIIYKVTYKMPKTESFFILGDTECTYEVAAEIIREKVTNVDETLGTYTIEKKSTPVNGAISFSGEDLNLVDLCNADIDKLSSVNIMPMNLLNHILEMKNTAENKLDLFSDMCRYGGVFRDGGNCLAHSIKAEKVSVNEMELVKLNSLIRGETNTVEYSWSLSTSRPYFTIGFEYNLTGNTPDFETVDPHFYQAIEIIK